jgi:hypothetical protein
MLKKSVQNLAPGDIAFEYFTYANGAVPATLLTTQSWTNITGTQAIATNQLQMSTASAMRTVTHASRDVMLRSKLVSKLGEAIIVRRDSVGYYYVANTSTGTKVGYFLTSGSVDTQLALITGNAANDVVTVIAQGANIDVIRNNSIIYQFLDNRTLATAKDHGLLNYTAGTVLFDDFFLIPTL